MGEVEAMRDKVTRHELRHDRHTVSLLTDHKTFKKNYEKGCIKGIRRGI